jgi:hypothetical protein
MLIIEISEGKEKQGQEGRKKNALRTLELLINTLNWNSGIQPTCRTGKRRYDFILHYLSSIVLSLH